jgi:P27 family predicted phage terminase small subunit
MGSRGPIAKFPQGKVAEGHRARSRQTAVVALPDAPAPSAPDALKSGGREAWRAAFTSAPWLRSDADLDLVRQWADLHDEREELRRLVEEHGRTATGSMGQLVTSPYVEQLRAVEGQMLRLAAVLGLGPQNAARLGVAVTRLRQAPSILEELFRRHGAEDELVILGED